MMEALTIDKVTKRFGRQQVLNDVSFTIQPGKIYGLLGRNGAGKSTLLNIITNRIFPSAGKVTLGGVDVNNNDRALGQIFLASEANLYPKRTTVRQMFDLANGAYGEFDYKNAERQLSDFGFEPSAQLSNLSTGQQTLAKLVVALNVNANYILLDEPALGLDANHRDQFYRELLKTYEERPRTFILSTHLIEEVQQVVEHVVIINNHRVIEDADVQSMFDRAYAISGPADLVDQYVTGLRVLATEDLGKVRTAYVFDHLDDQRVVPDQVKIAHYDLQHLFIYLTNRGGQHND